MDRAADMPIHPRGPSLYATLATIGATRHADAAMDALVTSLSPRVVDEVAGVVREVARRAYVDGLRDGFVQGVQAESDQYGSCLGEIETQKAATRS